MPENLQHQTTQNDVRINIHQSKDLNYWTSKFGVSVINLKIAVSESSGKAGDVEQWLKSHKYIS
ncbi:Protein of unknown function [Filimonas lacunae]|uniref:DUF3606 domain-containing protein n=1 Tax=Filimonas lacunae TaxID=477680 RepID=A0A1N7QWT0_9BACT|nr:DUF3606 domain-containing protein [Filimonas lacunae]SIT27328.1 Protein of unknown function [Filimonas lacunae]